MSIYNMTIYKRERQRSFFIKTLAWLLRNAAAAVLLIGFGALLATAHNLTFTIITVCLIFAGIWGQHYLSTRH